MMITDLSQFLSAGYFITKRVSRPSYTSADLLPSKILSVSECICPCIPHTWCIAWTGDDLERRTEKAKVFNLSDEVLHAMTAWVTERMEYEIGWPNACYSLETVKVLAKQFLPHDSDIMIIGIGLHQQHRDVLCRAAEPPAQQNGYAPIGRQGIHTAILKGQALEPGGRVLGFEPLVFKHSLSDSWLCNGLEVIVENQLDIRPNAFGFLEDFETASKCVEFISSDHVSAEAGLWLPWLLVEYPKLKQTQ